MPTTFGPRAIQASADDASELATTVVSITANPLANCEATSIWNAWRFTGVNIPAGQTITAAYLTVRFTSSSLDEPDVTIYGLDVSSPAQFAASNADISGRTRTTASVNWSNANAGTGDVNTSDLTTIVQELYDSYGPYSNGVMGFCMTSRANDTLRDTSVTSYDGSTTLCARLTITFTGPSASLSPSASVSQSRSISPSSSSSPSVSSSVSSSISKSSSISPSISPSASVSSSVSRSVSSSSSVSPSVSYSASVSSSVSSSISQSSSISPSSSSTQYVQDIVLRITIIPSSSISPSISESSSSSSSISQSISVSKSSSVSPSISPSSGGNTPITSVLDNFNRTNEDPLNVSNWGNPIFPNSIGLQVFGNTAVPKKFSPEDIATPSIKFDARILSSLWQNTSGTTPVTTTGQSVARWNDLSGNSRNLTQSTVAAQPLYHATGLNGRPAISFASNPGDWNYMLTSSFLGAGYDTLFSLFFIGTQSGSDFRVAIDANNNRAGLGENDGYQDNTLRANQFSNSQLTSDGGFVRLGIQRLPNDNSNIRSVGMSYNGSTLRIMSNGRVSYRSATGNLGLSGSLSVGNLLTPSDSSWQGMIGIIYLFNASCTELQMRQMCHYLLEQYDLTIPWANKSIFYIGDSLTAGAGPEGVHSYPRQMADDLESYLYSHDNISQGGADIATLDSYGVTRYFPYINSYNSKNIGILWSGTNDIAVLTNTPNQIVDVYKTWCNNARSAGMDKIIVGTALPRAGFADISQIEVRREAFNTILKNRWTEFADALADPASDSRIGLASSPYDPAYYDPYDRVHMTTAGYTIVKDIFKSVLLTMV